MGAMGEHYGKYHHNPLDAHIRATHYRGKQMTTYHCYECGKPVSPPLLIIDHHSLCAEHYAEADKAEPDED